MRKTQQSSLFGQQVNEDPFSSVMTRDTTERHLLALDIATKTGFCTRTASGVWNLAPRKDESAGMRLIRFKGKLKEICEVEKIKLIAFEMPAIAGKFPNFVEMEMIGVMKLFCAEYNIDHKGYPPATLQKFATGKGKSNKPLMISECRRKYGIDPIDHNEADAMHLYYLAIHDLNL
jgi:Holliday junction resolvasome RuvABC endonuclease subunit